MSDNAAAEKIVARYEREKERAKKMEEMAKEGLNLLSSDIKKRAQLAQEIQKARDRGGNAEYADFERRWSKRFGGTAEDECKGTEPKLWERD